MPVSIPAVRANTDGSMALGGNPSLNAYAGQIRVTIENTNQDNKDPGEVVTSNIDVTLLHGDVINTHGTVFAPRGSWVEACKAFGAEGFSEYGPSFENGEHFGSWTLASNYEMRYYYDVQYSSDSGFGGDFDTLFRTSHEQYNNKSLAHAELDAHPAGYLKSLGYFRGKKVIPWTFSGGLWSTLGIATTLPSTDISLADFINVVPGNSTLNGVVHYTIIGGK